MNDIVDLFQGVNNGFLPVLSSLGQSLVLLLPVPIAAGVVLYLLRLRRRYLKLRAHPLEAALLSECEQFLQMLNYQSTLSRSGEVGVAWKALSGKWSAGSEMEERPLSLPGLTAKCSDLLEKVAQVFGGKVVICIDELDKITDINQLMDLLKGIKGLFGQERTNFILTISEDAVEKFNARLTNERNLVESSFEDIIVLERLDLSIATKLICQTAGTSSESISEDVQLSYGLIWLFAGGIPREIKRNLYDCHTTLGPVDNLAPLDVWRVMFCGMLLDVASTGRGTSVSSMDDHFELLVVVDELMKMAQEVGPKTKFTHFFVNACSILESRMGRAISSRRGGGVESVQRVADVADVAASRLVFLPRVVEIALGMAALAVAKRVILIELTEGMIHSAKRISGNAKYALFALQNMLSERVEDRDAREAMLALLRHVGFPDVAEINHSAQRVRSGGATRRRSRRTQSAQV
jgi:hypothetical protein